MKERVVLRRTVTQAVDEEVREFIMKHQLRRNESFNTILRRILKIDEV